jgi:hypothetical protein
MAFNGFIIFSIVFFSISLVINLLYFYLAVWYVVFCSITHTLVHLKLLFRNRFLMFFPYGLDYQNTFVYFIFFFIVYVLPECINCGFFMSPIMVLIFLSWKIFTSFLISFRDLRGRDRIVVGFKTTYAISAYHR